METVFKINNFDSLSEETQKEIQDYVSGITIEWEIECFAHCDVCSEKSVLLTIETDGGILRVCKKCEEKLSNNIDKSLFDYNN